jgi:hypothetical protein
MQWGMPVITCISLACKKVSYISLSWLVHPCSGIWTFLIIYFIIDTSRPPRVLEENGRGYWFIDRETMEEEIRQHKFLEYGEYNGHLYGSKLDSIRDVIRQGKMCVLDCSPAVSINSSNYVYRLEP